MIRNELTNIAVEKQPESERKSFDDIVSEYKFGKVTYTVRLHFNLEAKRSLKDIVGDMICRDKEFGPRFNKQRLYKKVQSS